MADGDRPPIQFAPARGARIAYQDFGEGPPVIVAIPPLAQNIEMAWEWPDIRAMLERFGSFSRYIHFDKRGTGVSDRRSRVNVIDERVDDLRAVMDHAGVGSAHLFVSSEGGPMGILFAATYPDRVESLVLNGTFAAFPTEKVTEQVRAEMLERARAFAMAWGTPDSPVVDRFAPSLAGDPAFREWHQRYERNAASSDSLVELSELMIDTDVRDVLADLDVPTLVIHRSGDRAVPVELGRELAARIPGARLLELPGEDHFGYAGDVDGWMSEMERFVTGQVVSRPPREKARAAVRIDTLGRFAVSVGGEEVPISAWGSRLARTLLKRLVAARGWPVTRDELMDLLWPDEHDRARLGARLSVQLSAVRRVLRGGVAADRETVRLDLDEVSTDVEDLYRAGDDAAIVAAYTGEFLPEDRYDDWAAGPRDEARSRFVTAARSLAGRDMGRGDHRRAAELARRLIEVDRYDDAAHRMLIASLREDGRLGEAQRAHETWAAVFAELDIEVEPFAAS